MTGLVEQERIQREQKELNEIMGNFKDYIYNLVFSLDRYASSIYGSLNKVYSQILKGKSEKECVKVASFLYGEADNIIKMKELNFVIESMKLLTRKYDMMLTRIAGISNPDVVYEFSVTGLKLFTHEVENINWNKISFNIYNNDETKKDELYKFNDYLQFVMDDYEKKHFEAEKSVKTQEDIINSFKKLNENLNAILDRLKVLMENVSSPAVGALIAREVINIMVLVYMVSSNLKFVLKK